MVKLLKPVPGTSADGENTVVTPVGAPLTDSARLVGRFPLGETQVNLTFVALPAVNDTGAPAAVSVQFGVIAVTVNAMAAVFVKPPPLAVTVTV